MDIFQTARYFDDQGFDVWDFTNSVWLPNAVKGQLKKTDTFTEIWNRPTRKRLLTCAPGQEPSSPVIRVPTTGEMFMVGASHKDSWGKYYRFIAGLHLISGQAVLQRRAPVGPSNDPGWAVLSTVMTTFGDDELRSAEENQDRAIEHYGSYFVFLPINTPIVRDDIVTINNRSYFILEWYIDSGLVTARATVEPDARIDFVYVSLGPEVYNTATQQNTRTQTPYNVTGRFKPTGAQEGKDENVLSSEAEIKILKSWIGVTPAINDLVQYAGKTYRVDSVEQNALQTEWYLKVKI